MEVLPHEVPIADLEKTLSRMKGENSSPSLSELSQIEEKLDQLKEKIYKSLTPWERVQICRHPQRPHSIDFIKNLSEEFVELFGDRTFRDDHAVVGGFCRIGSHKFMVIAQEKGSDTESRIHRNFGSLHPEGFRKALRLAHLAEKFKLPVLFFLDTQGAFPGLTAEERGQGWAIAMNLRELARLSTPIIVMIIGEGCSGGALGMGIGDSIAMLEHAYYSVISPEGCASILWKDALKKVEAASLLKMQAENLLEFNMIDAIIFEPPGGAHRDPPKVYRAVKQFIVQKISELRKIPIELLLERRYQKFRTMGSHASSAQSCSSQ